MSRSASELRIWLALALLGLIGPTVVPRTAGAMGCHVSERPVLGLSERWEQPAQVELVPAERGVPPRRIVPVPCTGDVPGASQLIGAVPCLPQAMAIFAPVRVASAVRVPRTKLALPAPPASRLDRPPRRWARLAGARLA